MAIEDTDQVFDVEEIYQHPDYQEILLGYFYTSNGIALLKLSEKIFDVEGIMIDNPNVKDCKAGGWHMGIDMPPGERLIIKEMPITIANIEECEHAVIDKFNDSGVNVSSIELYLNRKFCSKNAKYYLTPGDEGIALVCENVLRGINVNMIIDSTDNTRINMYEDISRHEEWIVSTYILYNTNETEMNGKTNLQFKSILILSWILFIFND